MNGIPANIVGNLTRDPEIKSTSNGTTLARFSVAVERKWKNESSGEWESVPSFVDCVAWRYTAEDMQRLALTKGMRVFVTGRFDQVSWEDKDTGATRSKMELTADEVGLALKGLESAERRVRREDNGAPAARPAPAPVQQAAMADSANDAW